MKLTELGFFFLRAVHKPFTLDCNRKVRPPSVDRPSEALYTAYIHAGKNGRFWPSSVSVDVYRKYVSKNYRWTCHERWELLSLRPYVHARAAKTALSDLYLLTLKLIRNILPIIINTLVHNNLWACSDSNFFCFWNGKGLDGCGQGVLPINFTPHISPTTLYLPCQISQDRNSMGSMWRFESFPYKNIMTTYNNHKYDNQSAWYWNNLWRIFADVRVYIFAH